MDAATAIQSRAIGSRLVERQLLTAEELEHALRIQQERGGSLGEILLAEFGVSEVEFAGALAEQNGGSDPVRTAPALREVTPTQPIAQLPPATAQIRRPIGEVFVELGLITNEELATALQVQRSTGARLGEVLIELGYVTRLDLAGALAAHWTPRPSAAGDDGEAAMDEYPPASVVDPGWAREDHEAIHEIEGRLRVAEAQLAVLATAPAPRRGVLRRSRDAGGSNLAARVDELTWRVNGLDYVNVAIKDLGASIERLSGLRVSDQLALGARLAGVESSIAGLQGMESRLGERADLALAKAVGEVADRVAELREDFDVVAARSETADPSARLLALSQRIDSAERDRDDRIGGLADDLGRRLAEIGERVESRVDRDEAVAASRADRADLEAHVAALELRLEAQRNETASLAAGIEAAGDAATDLGAWEERIQALIEQRLAEVEARVSSETARARAAADEVAAPLRREAESLDARLNEMLALRHREAQAARIEREELGSEFEAIAASVGERLTSIERQFAEDETATLRAKIEELEHRVAIQAEIGEEQVRVTELALREGLAALGEKLAGTRGKRGKKGKRAGTSSELPRSPVLDVGAFLASGDTGEFVAFAPTAEGYRLIELPGAPPELGSTVEVEESDGPLVVTRYGRSPIPFDGRPCAYLDRA